MTEKLCAACSGRTHGCAGLNDFWMGPVLRFMDEVIGRALTSGAVSLPSDDPDAPVVEIDENVRPMAGPELDARQRAFALTHYELALSLLNGVPAGGSVRFPPSKHFPEGYVVEYPVGRVPCEDWQVLFAAEQVIAWHEKLAPSN